MNIHEYQAKELLRNYGVKTLEGQVVETGEDAVKAAEELGGSAWVVKAQIYADTRAKSGGVRFAEDLEEVKEYATDILCKSLITTDSGVISKRVKKVLIEPMAHVENEFFLAITLDRNIGKIVMIVSPNGGVEIEKHKEMLPESFVKITLDPAIGLTKSLASKLAYSLGIKKDQIESCIEFLENLYKLYIDKDCTELEINPFILNKDEFTALDAKITFDDNALFRQPELKDIHDNSVDFISDDENNGHGFIELDGDIGLFVNGAGLSMLTIDMIKKYGGTPANFIDINGGASEAFIDEIFYKLLQKEKVKAIIINIFGGMLKCDIVASGIIKALDRSERSVPIIARVDGTNSALGKKALKDSSHTFEFVVNVEEAAKRVCEIAKVDNQ